MQTENKLPKWMILKDGELHLDVPLFLKELNVADTPQNRDEATKYIQEALAIAFPGVPQQVMTDK